MFVGCCNIVNSGNYYHNMHIDELNNNLGSDDDRMNFSCFFSSKKTPASCKGCVVS